MPIGTSDGETYESRFDYLIQSSSNKDEETPSTKITVHPQQPSVDFTVPPGSPTGEFKVEGGTRTPEIPDFTENRPYDWVERTAIAAGKAVQLPHDVMTGEVPSGSLQEIERAADLAGVMVTGPAPVASKMADGTLGSFMGVRSNTWDPVRHQLAQDMEAQGASPTRIWNKTQTMKGVDEKWRQEIDDSKSNMDLGKLTTRPIQPLSNVLDHPELYEAYPFLKDIKVKRVRGRDSSWDSVDTIELGQGADKGTLLHEVQHAIQEKEDFAKGGAPHPAAKLRFEKEVDDAKQEMNRLYKNQVWSKSDFESWDKSSRLVKLDVERRKLAYAEAYKNYERLAGEVEARNVDTRHLLSPDVRKKVTPWSTEESRIPRSVQKVVDEPTWATPYGYGDPTVAPASVSDFRKAANDNIKDLAVYGGISDVEQLARKLAEAENGQGSWDRIGGGGQEHYWRDAEKALKKSRPADWDKDTFDRRSQHQESLDRILERGKVDNEIRELMKKYPHTEIDKARLKKLKEKADDLWKW